MIVALDGGPSALAAQSATSTIPILFLLGADPAKFGFVAGGNMTGLTAVSSELMGKRLDLLREMNPLATTVAYLIDPRAQDSEEPTRAMVAAARALGRQAVILEARSQQGGMAKSLVGGIPIVVGRLLPCGNGSSPIAGAPLCCPSLGFHTRRSSERSASELRNPTKRLTSPNGHLYRPHTQR
jgi:hypothetical protein